MYSSNQLTSKNFKCIARERPEEVAFDVRTNVDNKR